MSEQSEWKPLISLQDSMNHRITSTLLEAELQQISPIFPHPLPTEQQPGIQTFERTRSKPKKGQSNTRRQEQFKIQPKGEVKGKQVSVLLEDSDGSYVPKQERRGKKNAEKGNKSQKNFFENIPKLILKRLGLPEKRVSKSQLYQLCSKDEHVEILGRMFADEALKREYQWGKAKAKLECLSQHVHKMRQQVVYRWLKKWAVENKDIIAQQQRYCQGQSS